MSTLSDDLRYPQMDAPIIGSEEETELAIKCIQRVIKNKKHQKTILQALNLEPYPEQGKNSKYARAHTKRSIQ